MNSVIAVGSRMIEILTSNWSGQERILVDGVVVSEKRSFRWRTVHVFTLEEEGQAVDYAVVAGGMLGSVVHRNGLMVASQYSRWAGFFTGFVIVSGILWLTELLLQLPALGSQSGLSRLGGIIDDVRLPISVLAGAIGVPLLRARLEATKGSWNRVRAA